LGKTVQLLALLQYISEQRIKRRFLVVCPTSVIGNWAREIWRFTPELNCVIHHGPNRAASLKELKDLMDGEYPNDGAVVVTSYALVRGDQRLLSRFTFDAVVLDEAQNIKNPEAGQSQAVRKLSARRLIALTGTPVENRLTELWSIMDFLNPRLLGTRNSFKKNFAIPVERYGDGDAADRLRRITSPFSRRSCPTRTRW
jgi:SNF2 family DNA or RNA helicase